MVQLEELLAIRHCVFIMGPPGAGKTQCWKALARARKLRNNPTKVCGAGLTCMHACMHAEEGIGHGPSDVFTLARNARSSNRWWT